MTGFWNKNEVTQFQLVTDLHYFFNTLEQLPIQSHGQLISNIDEIIGSCQTYSDLEKTILNEVNQYLGYADDFARRDQQTLAKQVKEWLDENFTTQITYKIFQDLFNLNEKYIHPVQSRIQYHSQQICGRASPEHGKKSHAEQSGNPGERCC